MNRCAIHPHEPEACPVCFEVLCWIATLPRWQPQTHKINGGRAAQKVLRARRPETRTVVRRKVTT